MFTKSSLGRGTHISRLQSLRTKIPLDPLSQTLNDLVGVLQWSVSPYWQIYQSTPSLNTCGFFAFGDTLQKKYIILEKMTINNLCKVVNRINKWGCLKKLSTLIKWSYINFSRYWNFFILCYQRKTNLIYYFS